MALTQISTGGIKDDAVTDAKLPANSVGNSEMKDDAIGTAEIADNAITNALMADDAVGVAELSATGTASSSTFLRGDNSWVTPTDTNTQLAFANDANNRVVTGDGSGGLNGEANLTFDGTTLKTTASTDAELKITAGNATSQSRLLFEDSAAVDGVITYDHNDRLLHIGAGTSTATDGDLIINSSGNVGIGTTSPGNLLHVSGASGVPGLIVENTDNSARESAIYLKGKHSNGTVRQLMLKYDSDDTFRIHTGGSIPIKFETADTVRVEVAEHLKINDGNLVIGTGGHGIDFSAQTATSATGSSTNSSTNAEILDHYERGTFTPDFKIGGVSNSTTGASYHGNYTRIGNLLYISAYYYKASGSNNTAGYWRMYGLPFAIEDSTGSANQSLFGGYTTINSTNYDTGSNKHIRWQGNSTDYLSLYSDFNNVTWTSGACEFQITGVLKIHD